MLYLFLQFMPSRLNTFATSAPEKKKKNPDASGSVFPTAPIQRSNPAPGKALQIKFLHGHRKWSNARGLPGTGMLKFRFDRRIMAVVVYELLELSFGLT